MTQKTIYVACAVALFSLTAGWGIGFLTAPVDKQAAIERHGLVPREEHENLKGNYEEAKVSLAKAQAEIARIIGERDGLQARLEAAERESQAAAAKAAEMPEAEPSKLPIAFGKVAELDAVKDAEWTGMAEAVSTMNSLFLELLESQKKGQSPSGDWQAKVADQNTRLLEFALKLIGKVPTNGSGNGEFTHPLIAANLMAALLENGGSPLTDKQKAAIAEMGGAYEEQYGKFQNEYSGDTPKIEKLVDEIDLRRSTMDGFLGLLTPEQRSLAAPADLHDRLGVDLFSPLLMAMASLRPQNMDSAESFRSAMPKVFAGKYGLDDAQAAQAAVLFDGWYRDVEGMLEPGAGDQGIGVQGSKILGSAQAQLKLVKGLLGLPGLSESSRTALLNESSWVLPGVKKVAPPPAAQGE